jgi:hypothetical protein
MMSQPPAPLEVPSLSCFLWSAQVTRAESSNPVPPLKSSGKRAVSWELWQCKAKWRILMGEIGPVMPLPGLLMGQAKVEDTTSTHQINS